MTGFTNKDLALMLTAYERYGSVGMDELEELAIDEILKPSLTEEDIRDYNEYLSDNGYETYMDIDTLEEYLQGSRPWDIIQMWNFGKNNYSDEWFQFNGYGNIDSFTDTEVEKEMESDTDFLRWLLEERGIIDDLDSEEIIDAANKLIKQGY